MNFSERSRLSGSRFLCLSLSNWFLNVYVCALIPLIGAGGGGVLPFNGRAACAVLAFAIGMLLPGPFCARLLECRSRKSVCLRALFWMGALALAGWHFSEFAYAVVAVYGLQGMCYGVAQMALGSTLVNDVLMSPQRNRGDILYAWAGRLGVPAGLLLGVLLLRLVPLGQALLWVLLSCVVSFLLVAQTPVPVKAPVRMPLLTCDRFLLPRSLPLVLTVFAAPFVMGAFLVRSGESVIALTALAVAFVVAFGLQMLLRRRVSQLAAMTVGYLLSVAGLGVRTWFPQLPGEGMLACLAVGMGVAVVSSRHLMDWIAAASHCQRGTAQNTCLLSWHLAFALGFAVAIFAPGVPAWVYIACCLCSLAVYFGLWRRNWLHRNEG